MLLLPLLLLLQLTLLRLTLILPLVSLGFQQLFPLLVASAPAVDWVPTVHNIPSILVFPPCQSSLVLLWILLILLFLLLLLAWKPCSDLNSAAATITIADYFPSTASASKFLASLLLLYSAPAVVVVHAVASIPTAVNIPFSPVLSAIAVVCFPLCSNSLLNFSRFCCWCSSYFCWSQFPAVAGVQCTVQCTVIDAPTVPALAAASSAIVLLTYLLLLVFPSAGVQERLKRGTA